MTSRYSGSPGTRNATGSSASSRIGATNEPLDGRRRVRHHRDDQHDRDSPHRSLRTGPLHARCHARPNDLAGFDVARLPRAAHPRHRRRGLAAASATGRASAPPAGCRERASGSPGQTICSAVERARDSVGDRASTTGPLPLQAAPAQASSAVSPARSRLPRRARRERKAPRPAALAVIRPPARAAIQLGHSEAGSIEHSHAHSAGSQLSAQLGVTVSSCSVACCA